MLDPESWRHHTTHLAEGRSIRTDHDCGEGRTLKVEHKSDGYSAYCWRCSDKGWIPHAAPSLSERIAKLEQRRSLEQAASASIELPMPAERDAQRWPLYARVWLYKAGLSNDDIEALGFYYNEQIDRVVMPVYAGDRLVYWQARGFDKRRPKYINPVVGNRPAAKYGAGPVIALTEDMLSAIRVGRVVEAWAVLGTGLTDRMLNELAQAGKPVLLMLDPDAAGVKGRAKFRKTLGSVGINAVPVPLPRDPKLMSTQEIQSCVSPILTGWSLPWPSSPQP